MSGAIKIYRKRRTRKKYTATYNGMWKVAYADFITAMMAFFLLMWLLSITSDETLKGVAKYFTPTSSVGDKAGLGFDGGLDANIEDGIGAPHSASSSLIYGSPSKNYRKINDKHNVNTNAEKQQFLAIINNMRKNPELQDLSDNINIDVSDDGLRIQIMDSDNRPMFKPNTYELQPYMSRILTIVGKMIKDQPNYIAISGHTASIEGNNGKLRNIDSWNISSQRANEVRKFLATNLINDNQVVKIVGMANREPFDIKDQYSVKNIRVSITLLNNALLSPFQQSAPSNSFKK